MQRGLHGIIADSQCVLLIDTGVILIGNITMTNSSRNDGVSSFKVVCGNLSSDNGG